MPLEWVIGVLVTVVLALAGALFVHVKECRVVHAKLAAISLQLKILTRRLDNHDRR